MTLCSLDSTLEAFFQGSRSARYVSASGKNINFCETAMRQVHSMVLSILLSGIVLLRVNGVSLHRSNTASIFPMNAVVLIKIQNTIPVNLV
jgi:hypothetical protein